MTRTAVAAVESSQTLLACAAAWPWPCGSETSSAEDQWTVHERGKDRLTATLAGLSLVI